jgi:HEPN domain-containing protein
MRHDPARIEDTQAWLTKAATDLAAGAHMLTAEPPFTGDALFHAQQAGEKALKGFLAWHDTPFGKTHDLAALGQQCAEIDPTLGAIGPRAATLTDYAWRYRYPGEPAEPSREDAESALALAREVFETILRALPTDVHPPPAYRDVR